MAESTRLLQLAALLAAAALAVAGPALAEDDEEDAPSAFEPGWLELAGVTGKGVYRQDGSKSKFREDYNIQSGADIRLDIEQGDPGESQFSLRGLGQTGEKQGFLIGEHQSERLDLTLDLEAWTEYYNKRTGEGRPSGFPFTNDGFDFYGKGIPSTDWFTVGGDFEVAIGTLFHSGYGDFHYRDVNGDQTTLKSGTTDGVTAAGSGPGSIDFKFPGRKKVDYDSYMGLVGGTSSLGNINWQTNAVYQYHDNQSKLTEPIYDATGIDEVDRYDEDTDLHLVRYDLSAGRHLDSDLYVFGAGFFSYERSDPEPEMRLTTGGSTFLTRETESSKVTRWTPALSLGSVYTPSPGMVVSFHTSARGHIQKGKLDEFRSDDTFFPPGDFGLASSDVERDVAVSTTKLSLDWKAARRITVRGDLRYQYRYEHVDSTQDLAFNPIEPTEIEKYDSDQHRVKANASMRYRFTHGRSVEGGYQFSYSHVSQDVDELQNQFILGDWHGMRHRAYLKASGRLMKRLRGELRAQYVYEERDMDEPDAQPVIVPDADNDKVETKYWNVSPVLYWMPSSDWSLYGNYSIGQLHIEPKSGSAFSYKTLTNSLTGGVTFRVNEALSTSASYTLYVNDDDVENIGHNASVSGEYELTEHWSMNGGYRYLGYDLDGTSVNDYDVHVFSLGVTGRF